jgi:hypothetical protein
MGSKGAREYVLLAACTQGVGRSERGPKVKDAKGDKGHERQKGVEGEEGTTGEKRAVLAEESHVVCHQHRTSDGFTLV